MTTLDKNFMQTQPLTVPETFAADPVAWFAVQAQQHQLRWCLAHADDGVIWGEWRSGGWHFSGTAFPEVSPPLRAVTLQTARLFSEAAEVFVWRADDGWRACLIADGQSSESYDEQFLLWGDSVQGEEAGFVLAEQGAEGLRHALPLAGKKPNYSLTVRHYLNADEDGQARVSMSRLVKLEGKE